MNLEVLRNTRRILRVAAFLLIVVLIYFASTCTEEISVAVKDDHISLSYSAGGSFEIKYADIISVTEMQDLDLGEFVSGVETKHFKFGVWTNTKFGEYNLCSYANVTRYIIVQTSKGIYVMNFESEDATSSFYQAFMELLQNKQVQATQ